ncbi:hypothetical protein [Bradyrhizobium cenepequi]|uniref:hypothetical protein n=1 Tax=Bradyrhizobium cenepequi TaxID=2821403 RepID=UPI001CE30E4C|nr:hypothetical protein [Bradyrhizobium cenepequi]MCA6113092.1 hypothetical protein [Bradyrhizobium cenepequi]
MKYVEDNSYADPEKAARRANGNRAQAGGIWNRSQVRDRARLAMMRESGTYVKITPAGAELFA